MPGELAIVLHAHMPYVEGGGAWPADPEAYLREPTGFGTWPFGEELLFEAIASCYLPLLDVLDDHPGRVTLSPTPVLCDQLEHPGMVERCLRFLTELRSLTHRLDAEELGAAGEPALAAELERSAAEYRWAATALRTRGAAPGGLRAALGRHARWTSSATHAILPLLATDAGVDLQLATGVRSHRARFGEWHGGLWLPECGYAPWLEAHLQRAGVRATCVELTAALGRGSPDHLRPLRRGLGPALWSIDRATIDLVWGPGGYPSRAPYRDYHRYTSHRHRVHRIDGRPYEHEVAVAQARSDAAEFVGAVRERVAGGGVCVVAIDAELIGHWWYEGVPWLRAVLEEADRRRLTMTTLDDALARHEPVAPTPALGVSSWGEGGDLRTWSGPRSARFAWRARTAELALAAAPPASVGDRALRELLALQSSDWAFLHHFDLAGDYPEQRAQMHADALGAALRDRNAVAPALRGLAPWPAGWRSSI
jgi:1,4-alpha-glucan branching enzyme